MSKTPHLNLIFFLLITISTELIIDSKTEVK